MAARCSGAPAAWPADQPTIWPTDLVASWVADRHSDASQRFTLAAHWPPIGRPLAATLAATLAAYVFPHKSRFVML